MMAWGQGEAHLDKLGLRDQRCSLDMLSRYYQPQLAPRSSDPWGDPAVLPSPGCSLHVLLLSPHALGRCLDLDNRVRRKPSPWCVGHGTRAPLWAPPARPEDTYQAATALLVQQKERCTRSRPARAMGATHTGHSLINHTFTATTPGRVHRGRRRCRPRAAEQGARKIIRQARRGPCEEGTHHGCSGAGTRGSWA